MSCNKCGHQKCTCTKVITKQGKAGPRGNDGKRGRTGPVGPAGPQNLKVNNTVFVMKNGVDATGLVERLDKPFLTIAAALAAAETAFTSRTKSDRIRIVVEQGHYAEKIVLKKFIDYDFQSSVIKGVITDDNLDMGSSDSDCWTNIIYGNARFYNDREIVDGDHGAMLIWRKNTKLLMYCDSIGTKNDDCIAIINGFVRLYCNKIYSESTTQNYMHAIEMSQGYSSTPTSELSRMEVIGADIYNVSGSIATPISFSSGGTDKNQELQLINCRVKQANSLETGHGAVIGVGVTTASNAKIMLYNTVLYATGSGATSIYTESGLTTTLKVYHSAMTNKAAGGAGTLTNALSSLTVDAAVSAEF